MRQIDYQKWGRREIYEFFSDCSDPFYMVTFKQDVSRIYAFAKEHGLSFYFTMMWACTEAFNSISAFRIIKREDKFYETESRHPSFSFLKKGEENFKIVNVKHDEDVFEFCKKASEAAEMQKSFFVEEKETEELIFYSCLPWLEMTALTNDMNRASRGYADDSVPRITWGKYEKNGESVKLCISMEVNHRFIDGYHLGLFSEKLNQMNFS